MECIVCQEEYGETTIPTLIGACAHTVCSRCIKEICRTASIPKCPSCREIFNPRRCKMNFNMIDLVRSIKLPERIQNSPSEILVMPVRRLRSGHEAPDSSEQNQSERNAHEDLNEDASEARPRLPSHVANRRSYDEEQLAFGQGVRRISRSREDRLEERIRSRSRERPDRNFPNQGDSTRRRDFNWFSGEDTDALNNVTGKKNLHIQKRSDGTISSIRMSFKE